VSGEATTPWTQEIRHACQRHYGAGHGANRGLGRAIVGALLTRSVSKVYAARRLESLDDLAAGDRRVVPIRVDPTDLEQIAQAAQSAADTTLLINNGGSLAFADPLGGDLALGTRCVAPTSQGCRVAAHARRPARSIRSALAAA
jgi:hypothetical protein